MMNVLSYGSVTINGVDHVTNRDLGTITSSYHRFPCCYDQLRTSTQLSNLLVPSHTHLFTYLHTLSSMLFSLGSFVHIQAPVHAVIFQVK